MMETEPDCGIFIYQRTTTLPSFAAKDVRVSLRRLIGRGGKACACVQYLWGHGQAQRAKDQRSIVSNLRGVLTNQKLKGVAKYAFYAFFLIHRFNTLLDKNPWGKPESDHRRNHKIRCHVMYARNG